MTGPGLHEAAARLLRRLGANGGAVALSQAAAGLAPDALEGALADLADAELVSLGGDGVLRAGRRGSLLSETRVAAELETGWLGRELEIHASVGSTNDLAMRRAVAGAPTGLVIAAELQMEGRGRQGRAFDSRPGLGAWSTSLLPAPDDPASTPRLSLLAALAVAEAVEELTGSPAGVKWPNDVRMAGLKVCGVLVEARAIGRTLHVIAGIGLNVHHEDRDFPPELRGRATSLERASGRGMDRSRALAVVLGRLESRVDDERAGRLDLREQFSRRDDLSGRDVRVDSPDGTWSGVARGVDDSGRLRVELPGGRVIPVQSAETTLEPAP